MSGELSQVQQDKNDYELICQNLNDKISKVKRETDEDRKKFHSF